MTFEPGLEPNRLCGSTTMIRILAALAPQHVGAGAVRAGPVGAGPVGAGPVGAGPVGAGDVGAGDVGAGASELKPEPEPSP
jgi:hypothetical protein